MNINIISDVIKENIIFNRPKHCSNLYNYLYQTYRPTLFQFIHLSVPDWPAYILPTYSFICTRLTGPHSSKLSIYLYQTDRPTFFQFIHLSVPDWPAHILPIYLFICTRLTGRHCSNLSIYLNQTDRPPLFQSIHLSVPDWPAHILPFIHLSVTDWPAHILPIYPFICTKLTGPHCSNLSIYLNQTDRPTLFQFIYLSEPDWLVSH